MAREREKRRGGERQAARHADEPGADELGADEPGARPDAVREAEPAEGVAEGPDALGVDEPGDGEPGDDGDGEPGDDGDGEPGDDGDGEPGGGEPGDDDRDALLPRGNRLRLARGALVAGPAALVALVVMAWSPRLSFGVPLAALASLVAALGVLDALGTFDDPEPRVVARADLGALGRACLVLAAGALGTWATLRAAVAGSIRAVPHATEPLSYLTAACFSVPLAFLLAVLGVYRVGEALGAFRLDEAGAARPLVRRHGFWLVLAVTALYLPRLGSHSLVDPWETHYGEVAREILARGDWISLWWAQDGWFWSKPVLDFWLQALFMALLGVRYEPGQMLAAVREGHEPWPEWAVRFPVFLLVLLATYLLYKAVARARGRRAGLFVGLALTTMPQWFFVAHQTMTDMPFVASLTAAMALVALALFEDPERLVGVYELRLGGRVLRLSLYHLVVGAIVAVALPQILYLVSRNFEIATAPYLKVRTRLDAFASGSGMGNCGLPGNAACAPATAHLGGLHPALQALLWVQALGLALYLEWGERRAQRLLFLGAWLFAALATMAKGPAGMVLPAMVVVAWVFTEKRPSLLGRMEIPAGVLVFLAVALPWFVAMYARHGQGFVDRLLFHDMFKRAFSHVHDTNEGDDTSFRYYLWQLGYATFPLVGLAPAAVLALVRDDAKSAHAATLRVLAGLWLVLTFCLFAFMGTKFHHYILPAVPALAVLVGLTLDELFESSREVGDARATHASAVLGAAMLGGAALTLLVGRDLFAVRAGAPDQARLLHLFTYNYKRPWPTSLDFRGELFWFSVLGAALLAALVVRRARRYAAPALVGLALVFTAFGLDRYFVATSPHWGQRELVLAWHVADQGAPGPLISYQQNWKGENFYTGNRIPAFVTSGKKFQDHVLELKRRGHKTFYFLTEPHRMGNLANELGNPAHFDRLVPPEVNNKFTLVRARFE